MRRKISPRGTHDYTSNCLSILQQGASWLVQSDLCNSDSQITDSDISTYLRKTEDTAAKMALFWIELYHRKEDTYDVSHLEYKYSLEHIMPKKWEASRTPGCSSRSPGTAPQSSPTPAGGTPCVLPMRPSSSLTSLVSFLLAHLLQLKVLSLLSHT